LVSAGAALPAGAAGVGAQEANSVEPATPITSVPSDLVRKFRRVNATGLSVGMGDISYSFVGFSLVKRG
jgi:hypothetical protein